MSLLGPIADIVFEIAKTAVEYTVEGVKAGASIAEATVDTAEEVGKAAYEVFGPK